MRLVSDRSNYRNPWTAGDIARLTEMLAGGSTIRDIADVMGRSQEAVRNRATIAGLMPKRPREAHPSISTASRK